MSATSSPIRIVLAEDSYLIREGITALIQEIDDVDLVETVSNADDLLRAVDEHEPAAVVTDIRMPPSQTNEGVVAARKIRELHPTVGVLLLSQYLEEEYARELLRDGRGGVGYLLKDRLHDVDQLVAALEVVVNGGLVVDPEIVQELLNVGNGPGPLDQLTPREKSVLELVARGRANKGIAEELFLSERVIERNINSIFSKLGLSEEQEIHKRVTAVLIFLESARPIGSETNQAPTS